MLERCPLSAIADVSRQGGQDHGPHRNLVWSWPDDRTCLGFTSIWGQSWLLIPWWFFIIFTFSDSLLGWWFQTSFLRCRWICLLSGACPSHSTSKGGSAAASTARTNREYSKPLAYEFSAFADKFKWNLVLDRNPISSNPWTGFFQTSLGRQGEGKSSRTLSFFLEFEFFAWVLSFSMRFLDFSSILLSSLFL